MRLVLTPVPVGYGTTSRCLAIAAECRRRVHEVLFACAPDLHERIRQHDFLVRAIRDSGVDPERPAPAAQQYVEQHDRQLLEAQLRDLLAVFKEFRPDVAVSSHNMVTMIAAAVADLPSVSVFHPDVMAGGSPRLVVALLAEWLHLAALGRRARPRRKLPPPPFGELSCIPSIPELIHWPWLQPPQALLRRGEAAPVGALLMEPPDTLPDRPRLRGELDVPAEAPVVYATVGGAVARERYVETLVEGLERAEVHAIITVGTRLPEATLQRLNRPCVRALRFLPNDLRAIRAADALLWHGGHETMLEAVACGIPAVGVPFAFDQESNVKALERAGAGLRIDQRDLRPERVADAVRRALREPCYRETARRLAESNRRAGGAPRLVSLIERLGPP